MKNKIYAMPRLLMRCILFLYLLTPFFACEHPGVLFPEDPLPGTDTCTNPVEYIHPDFVTLDIEITDASVGERIFTAGQYSDTISIDETGDQADIVHTIMDKFHPEFTYAIYVFPSDSRRMAIIVNGTNDVNLFKQQVWMRYNGVYKHYLGWCKQGFIFSGALEYWQYEAATKIYPSVDYFNFRLTDFDSLQYIQLALNILDSCKQGRTWADFRFNPYEMTDSIVQAFTDAGWGTVLDFNSNLETRFGIKGMPSNGPIDLRNRCIDWADVQKLLDQGYQVIINTDYVSGLP